MAARKTAVLRPTCPREGHENSRVWLNGHRGPAGHRRPRWKCVPANGDKPHQFSETLPRQNTEDGFCGECERVYNHNEGPQSARYYLYPIRDIARALIRVGEGSAYRGAAWSAREHARRGRSVGKRGAIYSEHGQLCSDWIETYAPVVYEPYRDFAWPTTGSVMFDDVPFRLKSGVQGGQRAFSILAAMAWDDDRRVMRLYRLEAFPERANMLPTWKKFMRSLEGEPQRIVSDRDSTLLKAIGQCFPNARHHSCEAHLQRRAISKLKDHGLAVPGTAPYDVVARAFTSIEDFETMRRVWLAVKDKAVRKKLDAYLRRLEPVIIPQIERRPWHTTANPNGAGPLETHLNWVRRHITHRVHSFTNAERLNRLLLLMMLNQNKLAQESTYAECIREWLLANNGRPRITRREVTDPLGVPSLRP